MALRRIRPVAVAGLLMLLAACSQDSKSIVSPDEAKDYAVQVGGPDQPRSRKFKYQDVQRVQAMSFCYSSLINGPEDLTGEAKESCKGGRLEFYDQEVFLRGCPLLQPYRITFICYPLNPPTAASP